MKTFELEIYVVDEAGQPHKQAGTISITASDVEAAGLKARTKIAEKNLPSLRSLNFTPDNKIVAYCGEKRQRPADARERRVWRRPAGVKKL
jgi:Tfp pilus assembly major pilin PilA